MAQDSLFRIDSLNVKQLSRNKESPDVTFSGHIGRFFYYFIVLTQKNKTTVCNINIITRPILT